MKPRIRFTIVPYGQYKPMHNVFSLKKYEDSFHVFNTKECYFRVRDIYHNGPYTRFTEPLILCWIEGDEIEHIGEMIKAGTKEVIKTSQKYKTGRLPD